MGNNVRRLFVNLYDMAVVLYTTADTVLFKADYKKADAELCQPLFFSAGMQGSDWSIDYAMPDCK